MANSQLTLQELMIPGARHSGDAIVLRAGQPRSFVSMSLSVGGTRVVVFVPIEDRAWAVRVAEAFNEPRPSEMPKSEEAA